MNYRRNQQNITLVDLDNNTLLNNKQIDDHINSFFTNLTSDFLEVENEWYRVGNGIPLPKVSLESVTKKLSCLKANKAPGLFDPNTKLIKTFARFFATPLTHIINESFQWKV